MHQTPFLDILGGVKGRTADRHRGAGGSHGVGKVMSHHKEVCSASERMAGGLCGPVPRPNAGKGTKGPEEADA